MQISFIAGGTGTPKLIQGFRSFLDDENISVICNTGDDLSWFGLHVSPDLDTVLYLFSDKLDTDKFWGVKGEEFTTLDIVESLGLENWFQIGNKDLGLHIFRQFNLDKGKTLTEITQDICNNWNIKANILPMCNQSIRSIIKTPNGTLPFQEFFVKHRYEPEVEEVFFEGSKSETSKGVLNSLDHCRQLILGPSNPVTSIGPILSIDPIREKLSNIRNKVLAISPIVSDKAFSGPSVKLMKAMNIDISVTGLAKHYQNYISKLIISPDDRRFASEIEDCNIEAIVLPIELKTFEQKGTLAQEILEII